jgi:hypothetical protein
MSRSYSITALPTRSPNLSSRTILTHEAYAQRGQAVSLSMVVNTEPPYGEITATSNNHEKKPLKSPGRPSIPPPQRPTQPKHNTTVPTRRLDNGPIPSNTTYPGCSGVMALLSYASMPECSGRHSCCTPGYYVT